MISMSITRVSFKGFQGVLLEPNIKQKTPGNQGTRVQSSDQSVPDFRPTIFRPSFGKRVNKMQQTSVHQVSSFVTIQDAKDCKYNWPQCSNEANQSHDPHAAQRPGQTHETHDAKVAGIHSVRFNGFGQDVLAI